MAEERFPRAKYVHALREMRLEMEQWRRQYAELAPRQTDMQVAGGMTKRAYILEELVAGLDALRWKLEEWPRLA